MSLFSDRLCHLLKENGISRAELSRRTGIPDSTLQHYARGDVAPQIDQASTIADSFGVSLDYLAGISDDRSASACRSSDEAELLAMIQELLDLDRDAGRDSVGVYKKLLQSLIDLSRAAANLERVDSPEGIREYMANVSGLVSGAGTEIEKALALELTGAILRSF